jgi:flagellar operon protein
MAEINGVNVPFIPAGGVEQLRSRKTPFNEAKVQSKFSDIFSEELNRLKFSAHANARIESRNIQISGRDMARLESAFDQAQSKGAKESLILIDEKAFIVNVPNKTVITAMDKAQMLSNVITNIDSAVIA